MSSRPPSPAFRFSFFLFTFSFLFPSLAADLPDSLLKMQIVPTPIRSYRLLSMSMDDDGRIWASSIHRLVHRYDPATGQVKDIPLPYDSNVSACICAGDKVYMLGQSFPRLIIYNRKTGEFSDTPYGSAKPDVWYGLGPIGDYLYLFDRGSAGVIRWNTKTDKGEIIPWPYPDAPLPSFATPQPANDVLWVSSWDYTGGIYTPIGIARLDLQTLRYTDFFRFNRFPDAAAASAAAADPNLAPFDDPASTLFFPHTLKGKLIPFDTARQRWCRPIPVPAGFGSTFGFIGGSVRHNGKLYFSLSTYDGDEVGSDGQPYHFLNALLEFDPTANKFALLRLPPTDTTYHQVAYTLAARGRLFATATNIREADGTLNRDRKGEVVFWQTPTPD